MESEDRKISLILSLILVAVAIFTPIDEDGNLPFTILVCPFRAIFGRPCPLCGSTRSFILSGHFRFKDAIKMNPIGLIFFIVVVGNIPYQIYMLKHLEGDG